MTTTTPETAAPTSTRWSLDASHSNAGFSVRHLMITNVRGEFQKLSGEVVFDPKQPDATKVKATLDVASINTREEKRDAHLRSPDFFDVEKYPTIEFQSRKVQRKGEGYAVTGELTIHGVTREVTLEVNEVTPEVVDPWGNRRFGAAAHTKIKRSDFGMTWNSAIEAGGVLVGDEVTIHIEVSLVKQTA